MRDGAPASRRSWRPARPRRRATPSAALKRDGEHRAERGAGRHAERERRRQRIAQQRLEHDAGRRQRGADQRRRQHARQPRDEEDLRVDVVGERDRRDRTRARQADRRAADERRRAGSARDGQRAEDRRCVRRQRARRPSTVGRVVIARSRAASRHDRSDDRSPPWTCDVGVDVVQRADVRRRQHVVGRPVRRARGRRAAARASRHTAAARFRSCVESTIVHAALAVQPRRAAPRSRADSRGRATRSARRAAARPAACASAAGDDDALFLAAAERRRTAATSRAARAGRRQRLARDGAGRRGPSISNAPRCG